MKIYEYEASHILNIEGIRTPKSTLVYSADEAVRAFLDIGGPVVIKAQVLSTGRGKAGGIIKSENIQSVKKDASNILEMKIKGLPVKKILIQERIKVVREIFLSITIDRSARKPVIIASGEGGVEIEKLASEKPSKIIKTHVDSIDGLASGQAQEIASKIMLSRGECQALSGILETAFAIFQKYDCELLEINPLAEDEEGGFIALDAKMIVDDSALFRHTELQRKQEDKDDLETEAASKGLSFVQLDGNIAVIGNGAGLVMATIDTLAHFGGKAASFCDLGGGSEAEKIAQAVRITLKHPKTKALIVNIVGGMTSCKEIATGLVDALKIAGETVPVIVQLSGSDENEGREIILRNGLKHTLSLDETVMEALNGMRVSIDDSC